MSEKVLFKPHDRIFKWEDINTWAIRTQYNELLNLVIDKDQLFYGNKRPNFYNHSLCLALDKCPLGTELSDYLKSIGCCDDNIITAAKPAKTVGSASAVSVEDTTRSIANPLPVCLDVNKLDSYVQKPKFEYIRKPSIGMNDGKFTLPNSDEVFNFNLKTNGLTTGAVLWLYFYERMGIFKILGALMDDYNYRGKYPISNKLRKNDKPESDYPALMDMVCTLYRIGVGSNLRDRICTYQRVLGVSIENNINAESERNEGFMKTFNKLIDYQLEYYRAKQLANAINNGLSRSSVATLTSIKDTILVLQQQFESLLYGRNQINTFMGISMVYGTISLVRMIKDEIGVPRQYERPEEFIPAAFDILVSKKAVTMNESNRFIIYDNCASYGYRLLTDIETLDIIDVSPNATRSALDVWLDDVEGIVEGYRNAYNAVPERVEAIV